MTDSPSCPVSYGQPIPGDRVFHRGDPWRRQGTLQDLINSIPTATDLRSAIRSLNLMNQIIQRINRGEPVVNNTRVEREPDIKLKGEDFNPHFQPNNWVEERREYRDATVYNPDDDSQFINIKVLKTVYFYNPNTDYRLTYISRLG